MNSTEYLKPLIHIGFPKTASTWLQKKVFSQENLGFTIPWGDRCGLAIDRFVLSSHYNFVPEDTLSIFKKNIPEHYELMPVISEETLAGDPAQGKYWGKMVADRLFEVFPTAKVFICIREQKSYILSAYKEYIRGGGTFTIHRFIGYHLNKPGFSGVFQKNFLEYDQIVTYYQDFFGKENVLVLPFEMLVQNPQFFLDELLGFSTGRKGSVSFESVGTSFKGGTIPIRRILNHYIPKPDWGVGNIPLIFKALTRFCRFTDVIIPNAYHAKLDAKLKSTINEWVGDAYKTSNRKTSDLIGLDLSDYGYDIKE